MYYQPCSSSWYSFPCSSSLDACSAIGPSAPLISIGICWFEGCDGSALVSILRSIRAGLPATTQKAGTSCKKIRSRRYTEGAITRTFVTTLPAPTTTPRPSLTPGSMLTLPPIQQSSPIVISFPSSGPCVPCRTRGSSGCVPLNSETLGPSNVLAPIVIVHVSRKVQLKFIKTPSPTFRFVP